MTDKPKVKGCTYKQWTTAEPSPLPDCMCEALRVQSHTANCHDGSVGCSALNWVHMFGIQVPWLALCGPTGRVESSTFSGRAYGKCRCSKGGFTQVQPATSLKNDHTLSWVSVCRKDYRKVLFEKESEHFLLRGPPLGSPIKHRNFKMCLWSTQTPASLSVTEREDISSVVDQKESKIPASRITTAQMLSGYIIYHYALLKFSLFTHLLIKQIHEALAVDQTC